MRKLSIWDIIISVLTLGVVFASLVPAVARLQRTPEDAMCQSNMRRFAEALQLYTADCDKRYPTNRLRSNGLLSATVPLSPDGQYDENGNPIRFVSGANWVEGLYPYLINGARKTGRDWGSYLKCPKASNAKYPSGSATARVSYVFNYNLLENYPNLIRTPAKLMMIREFDRLVNSSCRPTNNTTANGGLQPPQGPFLTRADFQIQPSANSMLHGQGSHILFADGHVEYFGSDYFPPNNPMAYYDTETQQWWNWISNSNTALNKTIAITP